VDSKARPADFDILSSLLYADDMVIMGDDPQELRIMIERMEQITQKWAMVISVAKTKIMVVDLLHGSPDPTIIIRGEQIEVVNKFTYLTNDGRVNTDIDSRINKASQAFNKLRNPLWNRREISIRTKMRIFNAVIMSILLYGGETWTILKNDSSRLESFQMRCLRCILQITRRDRQRNTDIRDRCCQQPTVEGLLR